MKKTLPLRTKQTWFALVDSGHCRLLSCRATNQGTTHVEECDAIENTFPEHEHLRPQTGDGMTHDVEEKERRFVGRIVDWLRRKANEHEIDCLVIIAPPGMLGALRKVSSGLLAGHLRELEGNLIGLHVGRLAEHPMIRDLMPAMHGECVSGSWVRHQL
jgi:protein required for attachment to host cells